jgi:hypothetical protein
MRRKGVAHTQARRQTDYAAVEAVNDEMWEYELEGDRRKRARPVDDCERYPLMP